MLPAISSELFMSVTAAWLKLLSAYGLTKATEEVLSTILRMLDELLFGLLLVCLAAFRLLLLYPPEPFEYLEDLELDTLLDSWSFDPLLMLLLPPLFCLRLRVWMPSFFIVIGLFTLCSL